MKPSDFCIHPFSSITQNSEAETIARNIMVILSRRGDTFAPLSWDEYKSERVKDGNFSSLEKGYFEEVIVYCVSEDTAKLFSPTWNS